MRAAVKWVSLAFVQEVDGVCFAISRSFFARLGFVFGVPRLGLAAPADPCSLLTPLRSVPRSA